jgi:5-methylcytosine-specific restriction endonuclease McrA
MWFQDKVEVIEEYDEEIRSVSLVIKMPAVVRLLRAVKGKKAIKFSRINVATRDNFSCQYCSTKLPLKKLTYDHVVPRAQGGKTCWANIVMACYGCNERKSNRTPKQAGMALRKVPVKPRYLPVVVFRIEPQTTIPDQWANYVYWHGKLDEE